MRRLIFSFVGLVACGGATPPPLVGTGPLPVAAPVETTRGEPPLWASGGEPADYPAATHLSAVGEGADADAAIASALAALRQKIVDGIDGVAGLPALEKILPAGALAQLQHTRDDGRVWVLLALPRAVYGQHIERVLAELALPEQGEGLEARLKAALVIVERNTTRLALCRSLAFVAAIPCEPDAPELALNAEAALQALLPGLRLSSPWQEHGLPHASGAAPLRPLEVRFEHVDGAGVLTPLSSLPLVARVGESELVRATTNDRGAASFALPAAIGTVKVGVDVAALEGGAWLSKLALEVPLRLLDARDLRIAIRLQDHVDEATHSETMSGRALLLALASGGAPHAMLLPDDLAAALGGKSAAEVAAAAQAGFGAFDFLVVGEAHAAFANRMGARSVWFEARGKVTLYDAWSGAPLAVFEQRAQAVGIGDGAAAQKALTELGKLFAGEILAASRASREPAVASTKR